MSTDIRPVIRPVGPERPQVYWRRRFVALVLVALVVLALVLGVRELLGDGSGAATNTAGSSSGQTAPEQAGPDAAEEAAAEDAAAEDAAAEDAVAEDAPAADAEAPGEVPACTADQVTVAATADATAYPADATAKIGMTITNTGAEPCTMDVGSAALEMFVVSGADRIWSSDDCQATPESRVSTVAPGEGGMLASSVEWPLQRSAAGCAEGLDPLRPGTYQVQARAGEISSEPVVVQLQ